MKTAIIIEEVRYSYAHLITYTPIVERDKHGLTMLFQGMDHKVKLMFDSREQRDVIITELDQYFGLTSTKTLLSDNKKKSQVPDFLNEEAKKSGYLIDRADL